jgi:hypothetical protein
MTRTEIVLTKLREKAGDWLALPDLVAAGGGYAIHSRVADLRRQGHTVENKIERKDGEKHSFYRLTN